MFSKIKKLFNNFFSSGLYYDDYDLENIKKSSKTRFINSLSLICIIVLFIYSFQHFVFNKYPSISILYIIMLNIIFISIIFYLRKTKNIFFVIIFINILLYILLFYWIILEKETVSLTLFIFSIPVVLFFLNDKNYGIIWLAGYIFIYLVLFVLIYYKIIVSQYSLSSLFSSFLGLMIASIFTFLYQYNKEKNEKIIKNQFFTDHNTGLPNRHKLITDLTNQHKSVLFLINIDDFKEINDVFGPKIGDLVLINFGFKILEILKGIECKIYKLAADEFAIFFDQKNKIYPFDQLIKQADDLTKVIAKNEFRIYDYKIRIRITIGIADANDTGVEHLLASCDMALKTAKHTRKPFLLYNHNLNTKEKFRDNIKWLHSLSWAIENNKILSYFQPIFNNVTKTVDKYECLVRMINEKGEVIPPFLFLDIAKKSRLSTKITQIMIQSAFDLFVKQNYEFSINLSAQDLIDPLILEFIDFNLNKYPAIADKVIFEIIESEGIENYEKTISFINHVKSWGCKIAIDDFGIGYSNFDYLIKLNIDFLKIDGSLIKNIDSNLQSRVIVESIIQFAKELNIKTIAEFVHNEEVFKIVNKMGMDYSQGYFLGKPEPELLK